MVNKDKTMSFRDKPKNSESLLEENGNYLEYKCGYGECTPEWLQKLHNPKSLVICLAIGGLCLGMVVNGLVPVSISTLEKRFDLTSTESGLFASMYKAASLAATIPVAHFGTRGHKGRYLGMAALSLGFGCFICAWPQFLSGPYEHYKEQDISDVCEANGSNSSTLQQESSSKLYYIMLLLGQIFHGFGGAPMSILAVTFIDDNVSQMASPVYTALYMAARNVIGPAIGYIGGGMVLRVYGDIGKVDNIPSDLSGPSDIRWYGAWWIGFLVAGSAAITISFPVLAFAKRLPIAEKHRRKDINQALRRSRTRVMFGEKLSDLPKSILILLRSPTVFALVFSQIFEAMVLAGMMTFTPKLIENLFNYPASFSSMISGGIVISGGFVGTLLGGYLIRRLGLRCRHIMLLAIGCHIICAPMFFTFLLKCDSAPFAGVTKPYQNNFNKSFGSISMKDQCNMDCSCSGYYNPVCDETAGVSYYSACLAGCQTQTVLPNDQKVWSNCSCDMSTNQSMILTTGVCTHYCQLFPPFLILFALLSLSTFAANIPTQQALLRSVEFDQRTLVMGLYVLSDGIGVFLGSIAFGKFIDDSCVLWREDVPGIGKRSCLKYRRSQLSYSVMGTAFVSKLIVLSSLLIAFKFYRPQKETQSSAKEIEAQEKETLQ